MHAPRSSSSSSAHATVPRSRSRSSPTTPAPPPRPSSCSRAKPAPRHARVSPPPSARPPGSPRPAAARAPSPTRSPRTPPPRLRARQASSARSRRAATSWPRCTRRFERPASRPASASARSTRRAPRRTRASPRAARAHGVEALRRAAGYPHARAELVDGDPCPLCGATEHPWHDRGAFDTLITDAEARLSEAATRGEAAIARLAHLVARDEQRAIARARLLSARSAAAAAASSAHTAWRLHLAALGELLLVDDPACDAAQQLVAERGETARNRLDTARRARREAEAVAKASAEATGRVHARQSEVA